LLDTVIATDWGRQRSFVEYIAAQPDGRYVICEDGEGAIAYTRVVRFDGMEELTELMVLPEHQGQGIGRRLLDIAWPGDPTPDLGMFDLSGETSAVCWVSSEGEIGPAVARTPGELVPVVIAALDRVAKTQEPPYLAVFATTLSWWLLRRLRGLGFSVYWPSWI